MPVVGGVTVEIYEILFTNLQVDPAEGVATGGGDVECLILGILSVRFSLAHLDGVDLVHGVVISVRPFRPA